MYYCYVRTYVKTTNFRNIFGIARTTTHVCRFKVSYRIFKFESNQ